VYSFEQEGQKGIPVPTEEEMKKNVFAVLSLAVSLYLVSGLLWAHHSNAVGRQVGKRLEAAQPTG